jgi:hypothetical protein
MQQPCQLIKKEENHLEKADRYRLFEEMRERAIKRKRIHKTTRVVDMCSEKAALGDVQFFHFFIKRRPVNA